jgi:hypothetical protein
VVRGSDAHPPSDLIIYVVKIVRACARLLIEGAGAGGSFERESDARSSAAASLFAGQRLIKVPSTVTVEMSLAQFRKCWEGNDEGGPEPLAY